MAPPASREEEASDSMVWLVDSARVEEDEENEN